MKKRSDPFDGRTGWASRQGGALIFQILTGLLLSGLVACSTLPGQTVKQNCKYGEGCVKREQGAYDPRRHRAIWADFNLLLAEGYRWRAKSEDIEHDFPERDENLRRAANLEKGMVVGPEPISYRRLPADAKPDLIEARKRLMAALADPAARKTPKLLATAQVKFDCWMEEQEENSQPADIAACRKAFEEAMAKLARSRSGKSLGCGCNPTGPFLIYFDLDRWDIKPEAEKVLRQVAQSYRQRHPSRVIVDGHADRAAGDSYNMALSRRRVNAVVTRLKNLGVPEGAILKRSYGERKPRVWTPDGVPKAENRRVEIRFNW